MKPVIFGCRTLDFTPEQLAVFADHKPLGMIIFLEVCEAGPETVRHIVKQFRDAVGWNAPIFVDNEGGLVNRFRPSYSKKWAEIPSHRVMGDIYLKDKKIGKELTFLIGQLIADQMNTLGVNVNCAPVVDRVKEDLVPKAENKGKPHATSDSFFNRSFSEDNDVIVTLAQEYIKGLSSRGVSAIVKHVPGYGRVSKDPHYTLPIVTESYEELSATDFNVFKRLNHVNSMMTSHLIYTEIDDKRSATISPVIIQEIIRKDIGFKGMLIADSIEMSGIAPELFITEKRQLFDLPWPKPGALAQITKMCIKAGCDVVMHSDLSRDFSHTIEILKAVEHVSVEQEEIMKKTFPFIDYTLLDHFDWDECLGRIQAILKEYGDRNDG